MSKTNKKPIETPAPHPDDPPVDDTMELDPARARRFCGDDFDLDDEGEDEEQ